MNSEFLAEFKLPNSKSLFDLEFFKKRPEVFIKFAKEFLIHDSGEAMAPLINKPKISHQFAAYLH